MNKTIIAAFAILVLVVGIGSNLMYHSAEAKGMPQHWLNSDGTLKSKYLLVAKGTVAGFKYPVVAWMHKN